MRDFNLVRRIVVCAGLATGVLGTGPLLAAEEVGARVDAFAEFAVSGPGEAATRDFVAENWAASALAEKSADLRAAALRRLFADLAGGTVGSVRITSPTRANLVLQNAARNLWASVDLELESAAPHKIVALAATANDRPPGDDAPEPSGEGGPLTEAEAVKLISEEVSRRDAAGSFAGVAVAERNGTRLFELSVGLADRERKLPMSLDTKFQVASIGKAFTQVVIHQLAAEGKLELDQPLAKALPDYPNHDVAAKVTLRQLLDHTSGLGDYLETLHKPGGTKVGDPRALADYLPLFVEEPLGFAPGSRSRYSNSGYLVLGLVIERATGKSYFDAVRERVFAPAGMTESGWAPASELVPGRAVGYFRPGPDQPLRPNTPFERGAGTSAGGGYSTAGDLLRFASALRTGKLLPAGAPPLELGRGIAGGGNGANGVLVWGDAQQPAMVVLANIEPPAAESLSRYARQVLGRVR